MGSFESSYDRHRHVRAGRSVLKNAVGSTADNDPEDLRRLEQALRAAGYLPVDDDLTGAPAAARDAVLRAIRLAEHSHEAKATGILPGSAAEIALRRALARGTYPRAHRAVLESTAPKGPRTLIGGGMRRALQKLENRTRSADDASDAEADTYRRAVLPEVAATTLQANDRLADILAADDERPELIVAIAAAVESGGRQGFVDVRDLWQRLQTRAPSRCATRADAVNGMLSRPARHRFRKLIRGEAPSEGDFS